MPPQPHQPRHAAAAIPAPSKPPKPAWTRSPPCSSPTACSGPAAPSCSPPSFPATDADAAADRDTQAAALTARFAELHHDHQETKTQLDALAVATFRGADTILLDQLPFAGDILPGLPSDLKARLFDAFDLQILWNKPGQQATVFAEITEATRRALPGILDPGQDGCDDTINNIPDDPAALEDLSKPR